MDISSNGGDIFPLKKKNCSKRSYFISALRIPLSFEDGKEREVRKVIIFHLRLFRRTDIAFQSVKER